MHSLNSGPLLKRLRIYLFGLTPAERDDNLAEFARLQVEASARQAVEDAEDEVTVLRWAIEDYVREAGHRPERILISPMRRHQISLVPNCPIVVIGEGQLVFDGIPLYEDLRRGQDYILEPEKR